MKVSCVVAAFLSFSLSFATATTTGNQLIGRYERHSSTSTVQWHPPRPAMTKVRRFVADLAMTGISFKEIKVLQEKRWGDLALKKTQLYAIIKKVNLAKMPTTRGLSIPRKQSELLILSPLSPPPSKKTGVFLCTHSPLSVASLFPPSTAS